MALILLSSVVLSLTVFAKEECDYGVETIMDGVEYKKDKLIWKIKAIRYEGKSTNITGTAEIETFDGNLIKSYKIWNNESISKQKTSKEYSSILSNGNYRLNSQILVQCDDTKPENNIVSKLIIINGANKDRKEVSNVKIAPAMNNASSNSVNKDQFGAEESIGQIENVKAFDIANNSNCYFMEPNASAIGLDIAYKSSSEKAKNLVVILVLGLSILLNIVLIWKR